MLGHSRDKVVVGEWFAWKWGDNMHWQGMYCQLLGPHVCPQVLDLQTNGYIMERLDERVPAADELVGWLLQAHRLLEVMVWPRLAHRRDWQPALRTWARGCPWLELDALLPQLYPTLPDEVLCHGDPTLANVLWRDGAMVLCDPIPPRPYIPSLRAVDVGKLLQSAIGWETHLEPDRWPAPPMTAVDTVLQWESPEEGTRAAFWAAVHCARILPYAKTERTTAWARAASKTFIELTQHRLLYADRV